MIKHCFILFSILCFLQWVFLMMFMFYFSFTAFNYLTFDSLHFILLHHNARWISSESLAQVWRKAVHFLLAILFPAGQLHLVASPWMWRNGPAATSGHHPRHSFSGWCWASQALGAWPDVPWGHCPSTSSPGPQVTAPGRGRNPSHPLGSVLPTPCSALEQRQRCGPGSRATRTSYNPVQVLRVLRALDQEVQA